MNLRLKTVLGVLVIVGGAMALFASGSFLAQESEVCVPDIPEDWVLYTVKPEDTLEELAAQTVSTLEELQAVNCIDETIRPGQKLYLPVDPAESESPYGLSLRCEAEEFPMDACRQLALGSDNESGEGLMERCRAEGATTEACRRMVYGTEDAKGLAERCRAEGYTAAQCRRMVSDDDDLDDDKGLMSRCEAEGVPTEQCYRFVYGADQGKHGKRQCQTEDGTEVCDETGNATPGGDNAPGGGENNPDNRANNGGQPQAPAQGQDDEDTDDSERGARGRGNG